MASETLEEPLNWCHYFGHPKSVQTDGHKEREQEPQRCAKRNSGDRSIPLIILFNYCTIMQQRESKSGYNAGE